MAPEIVDQAPSAPVTSRTQASCGRIVHVHMPKLYGDVRPGIVLSATDLNAVEENKIRCNVEFDDQVDYGTGPEASSEGRIGVKHRTVLCNLYDPLTDEQRQFLACSLEYWAEWMPYQKGQAQKTDELTPRVAKLEEMLGAQPSPSEAWERLRKLEEAVGNTAAMPGDVPVSDVLRQQHIDAIDKLARTEAVLHKFLKASGAEELAAELRGGE